MSHLSVWFSSQEPAVHAAMFTASATIIAASVAATAVFLQIGRQAKKARENNLHLEELKLKLKIYEKTLAICEGAFGAEGDLSNFIRMFIAVTKLAKASHDAGRNYLIPEHRFKALTEKTYNVSSNAVEVVKAVEQWGIVDKRMTVFQVAMNAAMFDIRKTMADYNEVAAKAFPIPTPNDPQKTFPWSVPSIDVINEVEQAGNAALEQLGTLSAYVHDFQVQMQQILVGPLFKNNKLLMREPLNPKIKVIRLDQHEQLIEYFSSETEWGRDRKRIIDEVKGQFSAPAA